jgi:hypothetical protein
MLSLHGNRKTRGPLVIPGLFSTSGLPAPTSAAAPSGPGATIASWSAGTRPLRLWPRLVHDEVSVSEEPTVEHFDCLASLFLGRHLDEPESTRPSSELVRDDPNRLDGSGLLEELAKVLLGGLERKVPDKQLCGHRSTS